MGHGRSFETESNIKPFLVADSQHYKRLCPSVRWSVRPSVRDDRVEKCENAHFLMLQLWLSVCECVWIEWGCEWGLQAPAHPSATILWPRVTCLFVFSWSSLKKAFSWIFSSPPFFIADKSRDGFFRFGRWGLLVGAVVKEHELCAGNAQKLLFAKC